LAIQGPGETAQQCQGGYSQMRGKKRVTPQIDPEEQLQSKEKVRHGFLELSFHQLLLWATMC
jgi:hypothetical protein